MAVWWPGDTNLGGLVLDAKTTTQGATIARDFTLSDRVVVYAARRGSRAKGGNAAAFTGSMVVIWCQTQYKADSPNLGPNIHSAVLGALRATHLNPIQLIVVTNDQVRTLSVRPEFPRLRSLAVFLAHHRARAWR